MNHHKVEHVHGGRLHKHLTHELCQNLLVNLVFVFTVITKWTTDTWLTGSTRFTAANTFREKFTTRSTAQRQTASFCPPYQTWRPRSYASQSLPLSVGWKDGGFLISSFWCTCLYATNRQTVLGNIKRKLNITVSDTLLLLRSYVLCIFETNKPLSGWVTLLSSSLKSILAVQVSHQGFILGIIWSCSN